MNIANGKTNVGRQKHSGKKPPEEKMQAQSHGVTKPILKKWLVTIRLGPRKPNRKF